MEFKISLSHELITCEECFIVLDKSKCYNESAQDRTGHFYDRKELEVILTERKHRLIHKYADLEQEESEYIKYCPLCKKVTLFKPVKFEQED